MSTTDLERIAEALGKPRQQSDSSYLCCCPAHDDNNPSLSISFKDGKILIFCHAGCSQEEVIEKLIYRDLWPSKETFRSKYSRKNDWTQISPVPEGVEDPPVQHPKLGPPSVIYTYRNIDGQTLGFIYRFDHHDGTKEIRPLIYAEQDYAEEWRWQGFAKPRPLYGLEQLKGLDPSTSIVKQRVLVVEGEKTAEAAKVFFSDIPVVSWAGGSKGAIHADWSPIYGFDVVIWPDNDLPGKVAAIVIADLIEGHCRVSIVEPPDELESGWDLADIKGTA